MRKPTAVRRLSLQSGLGALLAALAFPLLALAVDPPKCRLVQIAEWPVQLRNGLPVIEGAINGRKIGVLLDTGAYASMITHAAAKRFGLFTHGTSEIVAGVGGQSRVDEVRIDELSIAGAVRKSISVRVGGALRIPGVDFILGDDFFGLLDVEFDYAKGVVRLFRPQDCRGAFLAYWDPSALAVPMEDGQKIVVPVKVNGKAARALLDSGASSSGVAISLAEKLGIASETTGLAPAGCASGIGADLVRSWVARFDTVEIGDQTIRDPRLYVADFTAGLSYLHDAPPEVLLGTDFLRTHRVLASRSQRKVYFSYIGGLIFPATPTIDCDERLMRRSASEALAAFDEAIAKNSGDTRALLGRAVLRAGQDDAEGALSDLDAVIRIESGNATALGMRSGMRGALGDHEGALADSDAAIANGMRDARMYVARARLRGAQGDYARAIEEFDTALKLDPRHQGALRARGHHNYYANRFDAAENDFATSLAMRPNGFDSIWLSLSRTRRGLDGSAALEQGVARLKGGEWPAPVLQYLLGRLDREALIAAAASADEKKRKNQECEAHYYIAARFIADGQAGAARPLLEKARDECPRTYIEYKAALVELTKLQGAAAAR